MANENKLLLLLDLTPRLTYGVICHTERGDGYLCSINQTIFGNEYGININPLKRDYFNDGDSEETIVKPYLRPMSSMTEEERTKIASMAGYFNDLTKAIEVCFACLPVVDYCYSRHLDIHGLIEKGLALEAKEGMYKVV